MGDDEDDHHTTNRLSFGHFNPPSYANVHDVVAPLISSFDFAVTQGLPLLEPSLSQEVHLTSAERGTTKLRFWLSDLELGTPTLNAMSVENHNVAIPLFPRECRERRLDYSAPLTANLWRQVGDLAGSAVPITLGQLPVMVRSSKCHLSNLTPSQLVDHGEESSEMGGYFISNGNEKFIRLLIMPRRNYPAAIERPAFGKKGAGFSHKAVVMRSVSHDETSATLALHYLNSGTCMAKIKVQKAEYFLPLGLLLKCSRDAPSVTDHEIYSRVTRGASHNAFAAECIEAELRACTESGHHTYEQCIRFLGQQFRDKIIDLPADASDASAGVCVIERFVLVHLPAAGEAKLDCLIEMTRKLYAFVQNACGPDNPDALSSHEILLPGHIYLQILKENLEGALYSTRASYQVELARARGSSKSEDVVVSRLVDVILKDAQSKDLKSRFSRACGDVGRKLFYFLATGNLVSRSGLDCQQTGGFSVLAEKLNRLRYLSHFASVHRGAFFASMKTTTGRKLLPESWGFLCPVHTPDGAPCGLLNHLVISACPVGYAGKHDGTALARTLASWGVSPCNAEAQEGALPVWLDGLLLGHCSPATAAQAAVRLRRARARGLAALMRRHFGGDESDVFPTARVLNVLAKQAREDEWEVPPALEVALVPPSVSKTQPSPGLFLFAGRARLLRPVRSVETGLVELIGPLEQMFLDIAVRPEELEPFHTHVELAPATSMLSLVASLTPFSDFNQSPRNMYQCQMGKQTMGTAMYNYARRADNKTYRIQTPQVPLVQTRMQGAFAIDEYPSGTNAVVAVISYTGYDMDDAMIVNKSSMERGFAHASVYKTHVYQVESPAEEIGNPERKRGLDADGLPPVGARLKEGDAVCGFFNKLTSKMRVEKHKDAEEATVCAVSVALLPAAKDGRTRRQPVESSGGVHLASVTTRYNRNPVVGDKFSSRHGQKGVLSVLWPQIDMPFTESGMVPDVIINPHAFPSRMTIGMLVEIMAGKVSALVGEPMDATPFTMQGDDEGATAVDYFGQQLVQRGYSYHGSEPLYSGVTGKELRADIFFGPCYYQRLRHMVSDKSQVRSTGPVDAMTRQPIKGRKRHGGIRFGEMERDSLLAHGCSFMTLDRLLNCSDKHTAYVCCGSLLSMHALPRGGQDEVALHGVQGYKPPTKHQCAICGRTDLWRLVSMPYVLRYLVNELGCMGIKVEFGF